MTLESTPTRYGTTAIALHWTSAAAVLVLLASGVAAANAVDGPPPGLILTHAALGVIALVLTLVRIVWWLMFDRRPQPAEMPGWQKTMASAVHGLLYLSLLVMGASGIATLALSGAVPALLSGAPLPDLSELAPRAVHGLVSKLLLVLLVAHIGAAIYHQLVMRDHLLARMGVGR
jgi:cytochrome b561